ncbi:MAG: hypothetical protein KAR11_00805 [Phycisphaerae bacterium]|nr:hypothetical protein [Phycisphaerae bacterium]
MHKRIIDTVINESTVLFKQCVLAQAVLNLGQRTLTGFSDTACIKTTVGLNVEIEPIPIAEVREYTEEFPHFLLEVLHGRLVQVWQECLSNLFRMLVDLHFSQNRRLVELKKRNLSLDFRATVSLEDQVTEQICRNFDFEKYSERVKLLNSVFNPNNEQPEHLLQVSKHVQIRNSFQHRRGVVNEFLLKELGLQKISILDKEGTQRDCQLDDDIQISLPEFDLFRRALLMVGQQWRKWNG